MEQTAVTIKSLQELVNSRRTYLDVYFARDFATLTGRPETEVSNVLGAFIKGTVTGRRKDAYPEAVKECCDYILQWYRTAGEYTISDLVGFIASHEHACSYAVLVGRKGETFTV